MKALLQHHIRRIQKGGAFNAIKHCHVKHLHSIMLHDAPGNRLRIFFADQWHPLNQNTEGKSFSLAIHAHHCDVTLHGLFGNAENRRHALVPNPNGTFEKLIYTSKIRGENPGFKKTGEFFDAPLVERKHLCNGVALQAYELHTIFVPGFEQAAWVVMEGTEDERYSSVAYSNNQVWNAAELYEPMSVNEVLTALNYIVEKMER